MRLLHIAGLSLLLWLAGCATTGAPGTAPAPGQAPAKPVEFGVMAAPDIPGGELKPITAAEAASRGVAPLSPPVDLWDRIRRGFRMPDLDNDLVRQQEQWYASRPDYIQRMTDRSRKYLFHIVEELERRNMPTELALLPFIESAFNPEAVSSARAAGMWQFMPATGQTFDLKQNVFRDDRRDVLASTRAALDYLQKLYNMFGDWQLALAAYNWGEGSVARSIAKNQRMGLGTSYSDLSMPAETRNYVPKLQAVKNLVANPDTYHVELPVIENHPYFTTVAINRDIDVKMAARLADVPPEEFRTLNPSMKRPVILAAGQPEILLPWDNAAVFQRNFEAYKSGQLATWTAWSVPTTMGAAEAARRVGMTEAELRAANTIPPRMLIKAGSVLIVPRTPEQQDDVAPRVADNAQLSLAPEITNRKVMAKAGRRETVATMARRYRVTPAQVAEWNGVATNATFHPGQQVVLFLPVKAGRAAVAAGKGGKAATHARPAAKAESATARHGKAKSKGKAHKRAGAG
ncbi:MULTISPECIES: transglycosylase SLT domain-containing protein [Ramlibacter]|uniref:Transglycosylase SLT domain-containing protein n=1 Tax=Ramlibacter aquaticus TaxID=2780094 RepID=A0ABR9SCW6_9BURK|nr:MULTISPECIES: transglycosylase SLT domain-containing protein [Ramlibacter]MBE7940185.1 transglycosylase SLT domain-containing protein [Ramlibacter aquaticus]